MATKRRNNKTVNGNGGRGKNKKRMEDKESLLYEHRYEIGFVLVCAFSVILFLANFGFSGAIGKWVKNLNFGFFGFFGWIIPFFFFFSAAFLIANRRNGRVKLKIWLSSFLLIVLCAIAELIRYPMVATISIKDLYLNSAKNLDGGGFLGGLLAKILASGMAFTGSLIILLSLMAILVIFLTGNLFVNPIRRRAAETRDHLIDLKNEQIEEARKRAEYRSEQRRAERLLRKEERDRIREEKRQKWEEVRLIDEKIKREKRENEERERREKEKADRELAEKKFREWEERKKERLRTAEQNDSRLIEIGSAEKSDLSGLIQDVWNEEKMEEEGGIYKTVLENKFGKEEEEPSSSALLKKEPEEGTPMVAHGLTWSLLEKNEEDGFLDFEEEEDIEEYEAIIGKDELEEGEEFVSFIPQTVSKLPENSEDTEIKEETISPKFAPIRQGEKTASNLFSERERMEAERTFEKEEILKKKTELLDGKAQTSFLSVTEKVTKEEKQEEADTTKENTEKKPYVFPPVSLLLKADRKEEGVTKEELAETSDKLQKTLEAFGVKARVTDVSCGPSVTRYELQPEIGVKVSKITSLADDIKLNLAAADIRIEAPIPGKAAVGIEVPNKKNTMVYFRDLIESKDFSEDSSKLSFAVGKDIAGKTMVTDIAKMPHLLIAGATGSGKSVCINTLIMSILYKAKPEEVKFIMIDPKVVELSCYNGIPHLLLPVVTDPKKAAAALNWAVAEMNRRYTLFAEKGVRNLKGYNKAVGREDPNWMPQIVIFVDELADLMMVSSKEVEEAICRLAQLARAAGIHLVIATQRPSVNVITGLIKANIPSRIAFAVSSQVDSRTILDGAGAEKLLGKGDMLFFPSGYPKPVRVQGAFVSDHEVSEVVAFLQEQSGITETKVDITEEVNAVAAAEMIKEISEKGQGEESFDDYDEYFDEAGKLIIEKQKASIGMLQRVYRIGFNRAARIMDQLAEANVVSEEDGTRPRKVLMTKEEFIQFLAFRHGEGETEEVSEEPTLYE